MMKTALVLSALAATFCSADASVFLPQSRTTGGGRPFGGLSSSTSFEHGDSSSQSDRHQLRRLLREHKSSGVSSSVAMAIPGYGVAEQVVVGGFANFLSIYNLVITARILLSWFPQAQGIGVLQPVFAITDPYLNLFRGLIPPIFGLDLSPLLAFFLLSALQNATAAVGCEIPDDLRQQYQHGPSRRSKFCFNKNKRASSGAQTPSLNL